MQGLRCAYQERMKRMLLMGSGNESKRFEQRSAHLTFVIISTVPEENVISSKSVEVHI